MKYIPETPFNSKSELLFYCEEKGKELLAMGLKFASKKSWLQYPAPETLKEILVTGARYLHRGYYCPSPVRHEIIANSRRGRILLRPTSRSKISHRYYLDTNGRLLIAQSILPNDTTKTEYLVYMGDKIIGFAFDAWDTLVGLSEEVYENGAIKSYFCASCFNHETDGFNMGITEIYWEAYRYIGDDHLDADFYYIYPGIGELAEEADLTAGVRGNTYQFIRDKDNAGFRLLQSC